MSKNGNTEILGFRDVEKRTTEDRRPVGEKTGLVQAAIVLPSFVTRAGKR